MFHGVNPPASKTVRWLDIAKNLVDCVESFSRQQEFLREIDSRVVGGGHEGFAGLLDFVVGEVRGMLHVPQVSFYLLEGEEFILAASSGPLPCGPGAFSSCDAGEFFSPHLEGTGIWRRNGGPQPLLDFQAQSVLAAPATGKEGKIGLLLVCSDVPFQLTQFTDSETCRFLATVAGQVALSHSYKQSMAVSVRLWELSEALFNKQLEPSECVDLIALSLEDFLPARHRLGADDKLYVQILFVEGQDEDRHLVIRGSSDPDKNPGLTRVQIGNSVCGLLIENPAREYVLCDPLTDPECSERYRWYLGKKEGTEQTAMRSELAIALEHGGRRFAIINLESKAENAFGGSFVQAFARVAARFAPILHATGARIQKQSLTQLSTLQALESYLTMLGAQFRHSITTPWAAITLNLAELRSRFLALAPECALQFDSISKSLAEITKIEDGFSQGIIGFASTTRHTLGSLLDAAIDLLNQKEMLKQHDIEVLCEIDRSIQVECSLFMKEVFYNILNNSRWWILHKRKTRPDFRGIIRIVAQKADEPGEGEELKLNRFCKIVFWDNGMGTEEQDKPKILEDKFSRRGKEGTGFGLFAANQYVTSLGGQLKVDSVYREWFEVTINMRRAED